MNKLEFNFIVIVYEADCLCLGVDNGRLLSSSMVEFIRSPRKNANFGPSRTVRFAMTSQAPDCEGVTVLYINVKLFYVVHLLSRTHEPVPSFLHSRENRLWFSRKAKPNGFKTCWMMHEFYLKNPRIPVKDKDDALGMQCC
ncbi:hypothetical protein AgCh_012280 [Apium graveolens]